jgi:hypothetical protein
MGAVGPYYSFSGTHADKLAWLFEYTGGGAVADIKDSCLTASHRDSQFTVAALHQWSHTEPKPLDAKCISTAEEWIREVIHPNSAGGPLPCVSLISIRNE